MTEQTPWGPQGELIHQRTYARTKPDGTPESWPETVARVVEGNLGLVYGPMPQWSVEVAQEYVQLRDMMTAMKIIPAGRHLWASGVPGRQFLQNCFTAGWTDRFADHFTFTLLRLAEGGGVGSNYSSKFLEQYGPVLRSLNVHIVCDPEHPNYEEMLAAGLLSTEYSHEWPGAYPVGDSRELWAEALDDLLSTFFKEDVKHANRVYDLSRVRRKGAPLRSSGGTASGPEPFARLLVRVGEILSERFAAEAVHVGLGNVTPLDAMEIDHEIGSCVVAGGNRRSARMSILPWDDLWIEEFLACKQDPAKHWTTNISVGVDEEFFAQLAYPESLPEGATWARGCATEVLRMVAEGMLANGEPGIWNMAKSAEGELNVPYSTNPCGEIILEPWEPCNLGHVNLDAFAGDFGEESARGLMDAHMLMTRFLMRATYGDVTDEKQAEVMARNRRIGVGHFGAQGFLAKAGVRYSDAPDDQAFRGLLGVCYRAVREEARRYAFELRIPEPIKVTTVAPTGTIAKLAGRTEGIHPVYARHFLRRVRFSTTDPADVAQVAKLAEEGHKVEPCQYAADTVVVEFPTEETLVAELIELGATRDEAEFLIESSDELTLDQMFAFQAMYQELYADNAVSYTANVKPGEHTVNDLVGALRRWLPHLKGTTVFPDLSREQSPYERMSAEEYAAAATHDVGDSVDEECAAGGACPIK